MGEVVDGKHEPGRADGGHRNRPSIHPQDPFVGQPAHGERRVGNDDCRGSEHPRGVTAPLMALGEIPQGRSSNFPTLGGCHCSGRRVPVAA